MGGARTLDQAVHGLGDPLSGGFSSGDHDCETRGKHTAWESRPGGGCCARRGARAAKRARAAAWRR
eukprot:scaffold39820_cov54-Phaeocystis_antarctica.AAC.1